MIVFAHPMENISSGGHDSACLSAPSIRYRERVYLKDPTGARRFWPAECAAETDLEGLKRDRDQLWAEAVHRYKAGMPWWLETPELEALATAEQEARRARDDWELPIEEFVKSRTEVTLKEVIEKALG